MGGDAMAAEEAVDFEYGHRVHPALHLLAPVVTIAAVWAAKEGITRVYVRVTGRSAPVPSDPGTSWKRAIAWTVVTTSTAAVIEVSLRRVANEREVVRILRRGQALGGAVTGRGGQVSAGLSEGRHTSTA
jgi:hypothetical protein